jgi:hypothetical protein
MNTTRFCVELDADRSSKLRIHLAMKDKTGREFIEEIVDRLPDQLTKKKGSK